MTVSPPRQRPPYRPGLVLFDLDGTLVDSVADLRAAADAMLDALSLPPLPAGHVRRYVGNGIDRLVHRCLTGDMHRDAETALFEPALALFMKHYAACNGHHSVVYEGVREGLDSARACGARLGCVTNKSATFTEPLLARMDLRDHFHVVVSGDTTAHRKPHPEPLLHAARAVGVDPARTLMVGDSENDVRAARAAGMPVVCVSYGYNHGHDIHEAAPDAVLASLSQLGTLIGAT